MTAIATWTAIAESELDEILYYISRRAGRPTVGEQNDFQIRNLADEYAQAGAPRFTHSAAPEGWCYFRHKRRPVFYRPHGGGIEVMRVVDGSHDLPRQFDVR